MTSRTLFGFPAFLLAGRGLGPAEVASLESWCSLPAQPPITTESVAVVFKGLDNWSGVRRSATIGVVSTNVLRLIGVIYAILCLRLAHFHSIFDFEKLAKARPMLGLRNFVWSFGSDPTATL